MWSLLALETGTYKRGAQHRHFCRILQTFNHWLLTAQQTRVDVLAPVPQLAA